MQEIRTSTLVYRCEKCWQTIPPGQEYRLQDYRRGRRVARGCKVHHPHCPPKPKVFRYRVLYRVLGEWRRLPSEPTSIEQATRDAQRLLARRDAVIEVVQVLRYPGKEIIFNVSQEEWLHG